MEITHLIDDFGDDIFALALISTKDFGASKEIFVRMMSDCAEYSDDTELYGLILKAYPMAREADGNDSAVTLTGVELDGRKQQLLELILQKPFIVRLIIHMTWENDLEPGQIAEITGESVKYVRSVLDELPGELVDSLDRSYKDICAKISAEDKLKAYVIRSVNSGRARQFEVKGDAVPQHKWTKKQKLIVIIVAAIVTAAVCIVIPILDSYYQMRREEGFESYENVSTDEIFRYTTEVGQS